MLALHLLPSLFLLAVVATAASFADAAAAGLQRIPVRRQNAPAAGTQIAPNGCTWGNTVYSATGGVSFNICPTSDYQGQSINVVGGVGSATACADRCAQTQGCQRAVWDTVNKSCHIKGPADGLKMVVNQQFNAITLSTFVPPAAGTQFALNGCTWGNSTYAAAGGSSFNLCVLSDYVGASATILNGYTTAKSCADKCGQTQGCQRAVWDTTGNICHLKGPANGLKLVTSTQYQTITLSSLLAPAAPVVAAPALGTQFPSNGCTWGNTTYAAAGGASFNICTTSDYIGPSASQTNGITSTTACADLCARAQGCQRAVWDSVNNVCHVKGAAEQLAQVVSQQFQTITLTSILPQVSAGKAGTTQVIGSCGVNAQHVFLGNDDTVYLVDKTEANTLPTANGANAAMAASYSLSTGQCRPMYTTNNQFCAAGGPLGDGTWVSGGGNPAQNGQGQTDGLRAIRTLAPCAAAGTCQWDEKKAGQLQVSRWYPSTETMPDGSLIWLGGYNAQVFMPYPQSGNTPTAEYYPSKGAPVQVPTLNRAWPFSLYPLTHHMSDGRIFIVSGSETALWDPATQKETQLPKMPNGPRTYPSGGTAVLLPLTPANNYLETSMLCGGNNAITDWGQGCPAKGSYAVPANAKCDVITPLAAGATWASAASMPSPRLMGTMILLPDNNIAMVNGAQAGTQGFNCDGPGESMASNPAKTVYVYNTAAKSWSTLATQQVSRGYHSSATLLPDGSVLTAGSSPHNNVAPLTQPFPTEWRMEKIYPSYYDAVRPANTGVPTSYPYGGASFSINFATADKAQKAFVRLIRTGWSTHGLQMQQRSYELTRTVNGNTVTFGGMPADAAKIFPPGSALAFLVVDGVPSIGKTSIVGSGKL